LLCFCALPCAWPSRFVVVSLCLAVRCHSLLLCLVARHTLLFTVALVIHLRALMFVAVPNYLPLHLVVYLFFFSKYLLPSPPQLLFCYLVAHFRSLLLCFFISIGIFPHSLVQVEEFGTTSTSFIQL